MSVLKRNITGHDILALRDFISTDAPVTETEIKRCFFPGDPTDSSISEKVKLLTDAIRFLEEIDQIVETTAGYRLHNDARGGVDPRVSLLRSLHSQFGENGAYREVLAYLSSEDQILATRNSGFADEMNEYSPDMGWNETNLGYWERTMDCLGVLKKVRGADATMAFVLNYDLWKLLLNDVCEGHTNQLESILSKLDQNYLPVWTVGDEVGRHVQYGLTGLVDQSEISLQKESDAGTTYEIGSKGVNTLTLTENF